MTVEPSQAWPDASARYPLFPQRSLDGPPAGVRPLACPGRRAEERAALLRPMLRGPRWVLERTRTLLGTVRLVDTPELTEGVVQRAMGLRANKGTVRLSGEFRSDRPASGPPRPSDPGTDGKRAGLSGGERALRVLGAIRRVARNLGLAAEPRSRFPHIAQRPAA